jgi:hypothetical protein
VTNTNFLWEDIRNYAKHKKVFTRLCARQNSTQGPTNTDDIFEQLFVKNTVQEIVNQTDRYGHEFRNYAGTVFPMQMRVMKCSQWQQKKYIPYGQFLCLWVLYKNTF